MAYGPAGGGVVCVGGSIGNPVLCFEEYESNRPRPAHKTRDFYFCPSWGRPKTPTPTHTATSDPAANANDVVNPKRDLLTQVAIKLSQAQDGMGSNLAAANAALDAAVAAEAQQAITIGSLQKQLDSQALNTAIADVQQAKARLEDRLNTFQGQVQQNNTTAAGLYDAIQGGDNPIFDQLMAAIHDVNTTAEQIQATVAHVVALVHGNAAEPPAAPAAPTEPPAAPATPAPEAPAPEAPAA